MGSFLESGCNPSFRSEYASLSEGQHQQQATEVLFGHNVQSGMLILCTTYEEASTVHVPGLQTGTGELQAQQSRGIICPHLSFQQPSAYSGVTREGPSRMCLQYNNGTARRDAGRKAEGACCWLLVLGEDV